MKVPYLNALIIPQKCTFEVLDKKYVFVVDEHGVVHQREIIVTGELPNLFIVDKGLLENNHIILEGIRMVKDGESVKTDFVEPKSVMANLALYAE
ncbi:hypothetical protein C21_03765 [Arenibacter sp. NBRC 103722]|nr:hypothetical protein C21_03765 [Arenibacter sp. NBRC 103722]